MKELEQPTDEEIKAANFDLFEHLKKQIIAHDQTFISDMVREG